MALKEVSELESTVESGARKLLTDLLKDELNQDEFDDLLKLLIGMARDMIKISTLSFEEQLEEVIRDWVAEVKKEARIAISRSVDVKA